MATKVEQIRALNDELRQYLPGGVAMITPGIAALGQPAVERIVKTISVYDDFVTRTIRMRSTISARLTQKVRAYFSKSITTTKHCSTTRPIRPIRTSQSA